MNNEAFSESTPVGTVVYKLEGYDPEAGNVTFGLIDSGNFMVDPQTGEVRIVKALDREVSLNVGYGDIIPGRPLNHDSSEEMRTNQPIPSGNIIADALSSFPPSSLFFFCCRARTRFSSWCPLRTE